MTAMYKFYNDHMVFVRRCDKFTTVVPTIGFCCESTPNAQKVFKNFTAEEWINFEKRQNQMQSSRNLGRFFKVLTWSGTGSSEWVGQLQQVL